MPGNNTQPKIFISYSWTNPQHEQWVLELAERLTTDGINVILDKWDLKEGQDLHIFMEKMVEDKEIQKVLVICDKGYKEKANGRTGGVGKESQLISKEVYERTDQEKFVPIVKECDDEGKPCIPHYMAGRVYITLADQSSYEENYQKLVRNLYNKPELRKPPVGSPPAYVNDEQTFLSTAHKVNQIKNAILNEKPGVSGLIQDYLDTFLKSLEDQRLTGGAESEFDEKVLKSIGQLLPLKEDFVDFVYTIYRYGTAIDREMVHEFFEKLGQLSMVPENVTIYTDVDFDNYRFINYELFLYFTAVLMKLKKYEDLAYFIHTPYFLKYRGELNPVGISILNKYTASLEEIRKRRLSLNRISITADTLKARATRKDITFQDLIEADLLLHYVAELNQTKNSWFPRSAVYQRGSQIDVLNRTISMTHFEKIKSLLNVKSKDELAKKIAEYTQYIEARGGYGYSRFEYDIIPLPEVLDLEKIATIK